MVPTFYDKDFIVVDKITPKYGSFTRGDVVVFIPPGKDIPFIKRIIGLPWETIKVQWGHIYVCNDAGDCSILKEPYLWEGTTTEAKCWVSTFTVTQWFLVMGDNRWYSTDSRCCFGLGCVSGSNYLVTQDRIIGKVFAKIYPTLTSFSDESMQYK